MLLHRIDIQRTLNCCVTLISAAFLLSLGGSVHAQGSGTDDVGTGGRHSIQGRLIFPSGQRADIRLKIRLESSGAGDITLISDANGQFSFQSLRPGSYTVFVDGGEYYESTRESVLIESASIATSRTLAVMPISRPFTVQIYLRPKTILSDAKAGVLNAALAGVPKTAVKLYLKALEEGQTGDSKSAIKDLKAALVQYPNFSLALAELGIQYLKISEPDRAADVLAAAIQLAPGDTPTRLNYGVALLNQRKFAPAEEQFRVALQKTEVPTARMYLGITLATQRKLPEAERELIAAVKSNSAEVNLAHRYLGGVYIATRDYKRAVAELEIYLKLVPKASDAARIRATITELRNKS